MRFVVRHWLGTAIVLVLTWWVLIYMPTTPSWAILQLKHEVDNRDGPGAAAYVDFDSVVKHAAQEMIEQRARSGAGGDPLGDLLGYGAMTFLAHPIAQMVQAWAEREVQNGAQEVQIPPAGVAGAIVLLHRDGDSAYTKFTDRKGRTWEVHMARNSEGRWQVTQVDNIQQLLDRLKQEEQKGEQL